DGPGASRTTSLSRGSQPRTAPKAGRPKSRARISPRRTAHRRLVARHGTCTCSTRRSHTASPERSPSGPPAGASVSRGSRGPPHPAPTNRQAALGDLATVRGHGDCVRHDQNADAPGEGDPNLRSNSLLGEEVANRVDDRRHRLVLGKGADRAWHGVSGYESRADERQEDERIGERARAVDGLGGEAGDDGKPRKSQGEQ